MRKLFVTLFLLLATATASAEVTLRIEGIDDELLANVQAWIGPAEETDRMTFRALERHAIEKSRLALQALGYYDPQISTEREINGNQVTCRLLVDAGQPVLITRIDIRLSGDGHRELDELIAASTLRVGEVFHHGAYDAFRDSFLRSALMLGYFDASYSQQEARIDPARHSAEITLALTTGARHRIGEITIDGKGLNQDLISRFPRFRPGDWYNATQIAELHRDLVRAGWFESVRIIADPDPAQPLTVPVVIRYILRKRNRVGLGTGFSTDVGPRVKAQWEKPRLNRRGHSMGAYAELSEVRSQFESSYLVPLQDPVTAQLAFTYGLQVEELQDYDFWRTTAGIEHRQRLANRWRLTRAVQVERETDDFGVREESTTLVIPGVTLSRTDSEGTLLVERGWRATAKLQAASRDLLSDAEMLRFTLNAKAIQSFGSRTRGIVRGTLGAMATPDIHDIPLSLRFFTGGDQSVRGYDYQSIGPLDDQGLLIGGRYNLEGSLEMDYRFAERWLVALFADSGSSFDKQQSPDFFDGLGAGIRWLSPIGPLRLDFAYGVSLPDPSFNIHFYMGPEL